MPVKWKRIADWSKQRTLPLRIAAQLGRGRGRLRWLDDLPAIAAAPIQPNLRNWNDHQFAALWIGHATVLLRLGPYTILTDPVFSTRIGLGLGLLTAGPQRLVAPAIPITQLPPIDLLLISHAHFDHLDRPTLNQLDRSIPVITASATRDLLMDLGFKSIVELGWGQRHQPLPDLSVTARPVRHWGARTFIDDHRGYNAYLIEAAGRRILFGGDSAYQQLHADLGRTGVDLAIMGIGAYNPWINGHATPEQALAMADHCGAQFILPMHHSTFRLSHEPLDEPLTRLLQAVTDEQRLVAKQIGEIWTCP